jgi:hypothetical protein
MTVLPSYVDPSPGTGRLGFLHMSELTILSLQIPNPSVAALYEDALVGLPTPTPRNKLPFLSAGC